ALIPFALAIGINVFVAMERIASPGSAALAGLAATAEALWFWFGMLRRKHRKGKDMKDERIPLPQKVDHMLTEARVIHVPLQRSRGFLFWVKESVAGT